MALNTFPWHLSVSLYCSVVDGSNDLKNNRTISNIKKSIPWYDAK